MEKVELLADLFEQGRVAEIGPRMAQIEGYSLEEVALGVHDALKAREKPELAVNFLLVYANATPTPNDTLYNIALKLQKLGENFTAANLFMSYVNSGGKEPFAYDAALTFAMGMGLPEFSLEIYEKAKRAGLAEKLLDTSLFNVATIYLNQGRYDDAAAYYGKVLERTPHDASSRKNLTMLARQHSVPAAIELLNRSLRDIARSYPDSLDFEAPAAPYEQNWNGATLDSLRAALVQHGFCFIRNGCHVDRVRALHAAVMEYEAGGGGFPMSIPYFAAAPVEQLYRFDARQLVRDYLGAPGELDLGRTVVRRVAPDLRESFVPFHQDSTAFAAALINIWTPMTPSGGEFPSLELVAKRVNKVEQTIIQEGEYNQIEIASDYVLERYKGLVYEVADAAPGDCVIFLGTTIHRSSNLANAVTPRYGLEVRWFPQEEFI